VRDNLTDLSFSLKRGQTLGIIGPTGSGKTTLVQLLLRFYDVDKGGIYIDGRRIDSIEPEELYAHFGVALQNDYWMADTISANIAFARSIALEELEEATVHAQAAPFIGEIPDGMDHVLSAGATNLSGGQKQRVLLSRALAGKPDILILDDSSSALDYRTDAALRRAIHEHYADTTTIIVAQRISAIMNADHILMLDGGKVIGSGTHEHLMQTCEAYQAIAETQMGGGRVG